jgi:hypothetical protein
MSKSGLWLVILSSLSAGTSAAQGLRFPADLGDGRTCGRFYNDPQCKPTRPVPGAGSCDSDAPFCAGGNPGQTRAAACQDTPCCADLPIVGHRCVPSDICPSTWGLSDIGSDPHLDVVGFVAGGFVDKPIMPTATCLAFRPASNRIFRMTTFVIITGIATSTSCLYPRLPRNGRCMTRDGRSATT